MAHLTATGRAYRLKRYARPALNPSGGVVSLSTPTAGKIAGVVKEGATPIPAAQVALYYRPNKRLVASQRANQWGVFLFQDLDQTEIDNYFVVALDPAGGTQYNAMIYDLLTPVIDLSRSVSASGIFDTGFGVGDVSFGDYADYIKGLVPLAYWRLKETSGTTFADEMGFAPLTAHGTFLLNQPSALFDGDSASVAYGSAGTNDFLGTGKITGLVGGATGFSIVAHVKLANSASGMSMLAWRNYTDTNNDYIYAVLTHDRNVADDFSYESWSWATTATRPYALGVSDDRWHMTVLTYTAADNTMRFYIDGYLVATKVQGTPPVYPNNASMTLFNNVDGVAAQSTNCSLAEVAVFDYPLTATQVMLAASLWAQKTKLNPNDKAAGLTLSNSDMTATSTAGSWESVRATHRKTTGRWYWETVITANPNALGVLVGIAPYTMATNQYPGQVSNSGGIWAKGAAASQYYAGGSAVRSGLAAIPVGAVIGHVYDAELGTHDVYLNGTPLASYYGFTPPHYPMIAVYGGGSATARFSGFTQAVPPGCTEYIKAERIISDIAGWNPADKGSVWTLSMLRPKAISNAASPGMMRASVSKSSGTRYFEVKVEANIATSTAFGVCTAAADINSFVGKTAYGWAYEPGGYKRNNDAYSAYGTAYTTGDVIGVLVDFGAQTLTFYKNGVSQGVAYTNVSGTLFPAASTYNTANTIVSLNMGYTAFAYALPSGAVAWDS